MAIKKRILLLGGAPAQLPSVVKAKEMGLYVITCDYLPENPGHKLADEYHNVSTTDIPGVYALAKTLNIDGILCYASDPAAPTAAYVAERLGLPGSPYQSVDILTHKDKFRKFLREHGFNCPQAGGYATLEEAMADFDRFRLPVMVKPTDSAGSKGVSKVDDRNALEAAIRNALAFSREKRFLIEEYVEAYRYQFCGDGFSVDGELRFACLGQNHFSALSCNPFVPTGDSWPSVFPRPVLEKVKGEIQRLLRFLHMKTQAYNFDIRVTPDGQVWLMEVAPRNGGNMVCQVIEKATGVDLVDYMVRAAMGEDCSGLQQVDPKGFWAVYVLHAAQDGRLKRIVYSDAIKVNIVEEHLNKRPGDLVEAFRGSHSTVGLLILRFNDMADMLEKMDHMERYIFMEVEPCGK